MKSLAILFALLALLITPGRAQDFEARSVSGVDGQRLAYQLLKPLDYDPAKKYPLVFFMHGAGERGADNEAQLKHCVQTFAKPEVRQKFPCFVVAPQVPLEQKWADIDWTADTVVQPAEPSASMRLAMAALDELQKEFSIDSDRLYIGGISMGGYGTWDAVTRWPQKWAAAVPICGGGDPTKAALAAGLPIWAFHGDADKAVKVERTREMIAALKAAGGHPLYSEYANTGHDSWTSAYLEPELLPWLFAQKRGAAPVAFEKTAAPFAQPPSDSFPDAGPIQPGIFFRGLWKQRRAEWARDTAADQGAVVFFGDSITQGWQTLAQDFPGLKKIANRGISGDTSRGLLYRIGGDVLELHPAAVSLLIGTNDLSLGAAPELVAQNIRGIVATLHAVNPAMPVILNKVMPRGPQPGKFPEKIQALNALLEAAFAGDGRVVFCDTWTLFADASGACNREEFPDMLHPNAAGYAKWAAALQPIFQNLKLAP